MLVSTSHQFLFVHVSKAAGTSVEHLLKPYCHQPSKSLFNKIRCRLHLQKDYTRYYFKQHDCAIDAQRIIPADTYENLYKFAFVRNPWDWIVSLYHYLCRQEKHRHHEKVLQMSFEEYLQFEIKQNKRFQYTFVTNNKGELIVDFIGRFENLADDFASIAQSIQLPELTLPHRNKSQHKPYQEYFTDETRQWVAEHWAKDIEMFGYSFDT